MLTDEAKKWRGAEDLSPGREIILVNVERKHLTPSRSEVSTR